MCTYDHVNITGSLFDGFFQASLFGPREVERKLPVPNPDWTARTEKSQHYFQLKV